MWIIEQWNLYAIMPVNVLCAPNKRPKLDDVDDSYLWHCRLGHINKNKISRLVREDILNDIDCESIKTYESHLLSKITKSPFIEKGERAKVLLKKVTQEGEGESGELGF